VAEEPAGFVFGYMKFKEIKEKIGSFLKEIYAESKKVVWPGRSYVTAATIIVLIISLLVAGFVMLIDYGFVKFFAYFGRTGLH
jgi:preprotein translocase SecE subunit